MCLIGNQNPLSHPLNILSIYKIFERSSEYIYLLIDLEDSRQVVGVSVTKICDLCIPFDFNSRNFLSSQNKVCWFKLIRCHSFWICKQSFRNLISSGHRYNTFMIESVDTRPSICIEGRRGGYLWNLENSGSYKIWNLESCTL